jgi:hypothetical protein
VTNAEEKVRQRTVLAALVAIGTLVAACETSSSSTDGKVGNDVAGDEAAVDPGTPDAAGEEAASQDVAVEEAAGEEVTVQEVAGEEVGGEEVTVEEIAGEEVTVPDPGPEASNLPADHTENMSGMYHKPGKNDPYGAGGCTACHGAKLLGGAGPSCYDCHDNSDHTSSKNGKMHKSGSSGTCKACHGPSNNGGIGPACATCH